MPLTLQRQAETFMNAGLRKFKQERMETKKAATALLLFFVYNINIFL